jgi:lysophospholipase L1-like esterase
MATGTLIGRAVMMSITCRRYVTTIVLCAGMTFEAHAANPSWRFDFGVSKPATGHHLVAPDVVYTDERGYGLEPGSVVHAETHHGLFAQTGFLTSDRPFFFSVAVPEGDYRVTVTLGDARGVSETTVKAESRRLMLEKVVTPRGKMVTRSFIVNVRNARLTPPPPNAPGGTEVRIKDRERGSYTWDDKLTLEFTGPAPKVESVQIEPFQVTRVFLFGDSTVTDQRAEPFASWGQMLPRFFKPDIAIANYAESGETLKSFLTELRLDKALSEIRPGDWVFIQFGHNDEKAQWPQTYVAADTTYRSYLRTYIAEVRRLGASPVLLTSPQRRVFDAQGHIQNTHGTYPDAVRAVGAAEGVPVIELGTMSAAFYEALGPELTPLAFADEGREITHHDDYGAYELARCVVRGIQDLSLPLADHLAPGVTQFDPSKPDPPETFGPAQ